MWYTKKTDSGGYTPPQSTKATGLVALPDELLETFLEHAGFVELEITDGVAVACNPDIAAYAKWKAEEMEREEVEPKDPQADTDAMLVDLAYRVTLLELASTK